MRTPMQNSNKYYILYTYCRTKEEAQALVKSIANLGFDVTRYSPTNIDAAFRRNPFPQKGIIVGCTPCQVVIEHHKTVQMRRGAHLIRLRNGTEMLKKLTTFQQEIRKLPVSSKWGKEVARLFVEICSDIHTPQ